jgi:hypothetical protein
MQGRRVMPRGTAEQDFPLGYSRARKPSGAPYPETTSLDGPHPVEADAALPPFNKNFRPR